MTAERLTAHCRIAEAGPARSRPASRNRCRPVSRLLQMALAAALVAIAVGGCKMPVRARAMELVGEGRDPVRLRGNYRDAYYVEGETHTTIYLSELPLAELLAGGSLTGQVLHIEILWVPKAGKTPTDSTATNATIRQIVMVEGEVGVFAGAGFVWPHRRWGRGARMTVRDATVALTERTDGFVDLLTPANLRGTFTARNNPEHVRRMRQAISQIVTDAFQESRFVDASSRTPIAVAALEARLESALRPAASRDR